MAKYRVKTREIVEKIFTVEADSAAGAEDVVFDNYEDHDTEYFDDWYVLKVEELA